MFPPPQVSGHNGKEMISKKKLESNKGNWAVKKKVIGWIVYDTTRCIELWCRTINFDLCGTAQDCVYEKRGAVQTSQKLYWQNLTFSNISTNGKKINDADEPNPAG